MIDFDAFVQQVVDKALTQKIKGKENKEAAKRSSKRKEKFIIRQMKVVKEKKEEDVSPTLLPLVIVKEELEAASIHMYYVIVFTSFSHVDNYIPTTSYPWQFLPAQQPQVSITMRNQNSFCN